MSEILNLDDLDIGGKPPLEFQFGGERFTLQSVEAVDLRALSTVTAEADDDPMSLLHFLLGDEQIPRFDAVEGVFSAPRLKALTDRWYEYHGITPGKSDGSSESPKTKKPKKR